MSGPHISDVVIAGGGVIGLSIGLELLERGLSVTVLERSHAMRSASWAAGGMLAARDPENPPALLPLSLYSLALYHAYLERIAASCGQLVPLRTRRTLQQFTNTHAGARGTAEPAQLAEIQSWIPGFSFADLYDSFFWIEEESLDPRDLCRALPAAFRSAGGILLEETAALHVEMSNSGISIATARERIHGGEFVNCCGAWAGQSQFGGIPVAPVKGQAVTVALDLDRLRCVLRTPGFYAIPRGDGRVIVGATIEHAGFDESVDESSIEILLRTASCLLPEIGSAAQLESWAGLRPGTPDGLPLLGAAPQEHCWHAAGHYRNGILLAPGTARLMAQTILGQPPEMALDNFSPFRFGAIESRTQTSFTPAAAATIEELATEEHAIIRASVGG